MPEEKVGAFIARHGERGLWLQVIEAAAGVMAARERMMDTGDNDAALTQGLAHLDVLLELAALPGVGVCAAACEADADAWINPGLTLARLIVAASWYLRGRRSASELCQAVADARSAVKRVAMPRRADVAVARKRVLELL